jgi:hypothetical protein
MRRQYEKEVGEGGNPTGANGIHMDAWMGVLYWD